MAVQKIGSYDYFLDIEVPEIFKSFYRKQYRFGVQRHWFKSQNDLVYCFAIIDKKNRFKEQGYGFREDIVEDLPRLLRRDGISHDCLDQDYVASNYREIFKKAQVAKEELEKVNF